ncbi:hypothetical protein P7C71_g2401, partial [Lecanoromycetidae sp. Uapishka_2]
MSLIDFNPQYDQISEDHVVTSVLRVHPQVNTDVRSEKAATLAVRDETKSSAEEKLPSSKPLLPHQRGVITASMIQSVKEQDVVPVDVDYDAATVVSGVTARTVRIRARPESVANFDPKVPEDEEQDEPFNMPGYDNYPRFQVNQPVDDLVIAGPSNEVHQDNYPLDESPDVNEWCGGVSLQSGLHTWSDFHDVDYKGNAIDNAWKEVCPAKVSGGVCPAGENCPLQTICTTKANGSHMQIWKHIDVSPELQPPIPDNIADLSKGDACKVPHRYHIMATCATLKTELENFDHVPRCRAMENGKCQYGHDRHYVRRLLERSKIPHQKEMEKKGYSIPRR